MVLGKCLVVEDLTLLLWILNLSHLVENGAFCNWKDDANFLLLCGKETVPTFIEQWLLGDPVFDARQRHTLALLVEQTAVRGANLATISDIVRSHYVDDATTASRILDLGASATAELLREDLPTKLKSRSGAMGEIIATEIAEQRIGWRVPVRRLRWTDGRESALRGDDIIGVKVSTRGDISILKGESKSRAGSIAGVIGEASVALDRDRGRPMRHTVLWIAKRLREAGEDDLALKLEKATLNSFRGVEVQHLLFMLTGTRPDRILQDHLVAIATKKRIRHVVGVWVQDHAAFIAHIFGGI
jgi:hypothetical protein